MDKQLVKKFADACFLAKKITELMPSLPIGMKPRHIHVIDAVHTLSLQKEFVKVSNISELLNVTTPSVTNLISELEKLGAIKKLGISTDKRMTAVSLTELGKSYYQKYVEEYHSWLADLYKSIDDEAIVSTINTVTAVYSLMSTHHMEVKNEV